MSDLQKLPSGKIYRWGVSMLNSSREIKPHEIEGIDGVVDIEGGPLGVLALSRTGVTYVVRHAMVSQPFVNMPKIVKMAAGKRIHAVVCEDGSVMGWGFLPGVTTLTPISVNSTEKNTDNKKEVLAYIYSDGSVSRGGIDLFKRTPPEEKPMELSDSSMSDGAGKWVVAIKFSDGSTEVRGAVKGKNEPIPISLKFPMKAVDVAAGYISVIVLDENGAVWQLGNNYFAHLGSANQDHIKRKNSWVKLFDGAKSIAAYDDMFCAVKQDGTLMIWGFDGYSYYGFGADRVYYNPTPIKSSAAFIDVKVGKDYFIALSTDGDVYAYGGGSRGQLGDGTRTEFSSVLKKIETLKNIKQIAAGSYHAVALAEDGTIWEWGSYGKKRINELPVSFIKLSNALAISASNDATYAVVSSELDMTESFQPDVINNFLEVAPELVWRNLYLSVASEYGYTGKIGTGFGETASYAIAAGPCHAEYFELAYSKTEFDHRDFEKLFLRWTNVLASRTSICGGLGLHWGDNNCGGLGTSLGIGKRFAPKFSRGMGFSLLAESYLGLGMYNKKFELSLDAKLSAQLNIVF